MTRPRAASSRRPETLTDNDDLKREGKADQAGANVKQAADKAADKIGDAVDKVKDKLTD